LSVVTGTDISNRANDHILIFAMHFKRFLRRFSTWGNTIFSLDFA